MMIKLPQHCIDKLIKLPESGMGYHIVDIEVKDFGWLQARGVSNCEWIMNTEGFTTEEVIDIRLRKT